MQYIRRWRSIGLVLSVMVVMSNVGIGHAVDYGIKNPSFRVNNQCGLAWWKTSGVVQAVGGTGNCRALLTSITDLSVSPAQEVVSTLEQGFYFDPALNPYIQIWYSSPTNSNLKIQVYDEAGVLIREQTIVVGAQDLPTAVGYSFPDYLGKYVTLRITAYTPERIAGQRVERKLYIDLAVDYDELMPPVLTNPDPEIPGGGGV